MPREPYCVPKVCATWAKCVKHKDRDQNMVSMIRQDKNQSLELTESNSAQESHLDILTNTYHATVQNFYKECMNIMKYSLIHA